MSDYEWKDLAPRYGRLDPYSGWLLRTGPISIDFSRLFGNQDIEWFLSFKRRKPQGAKQSSQNGGKDEDGFRRIIWNPDLDYAFELNERAYETARENPFLKTESQPFEPEKAVTDAIANADDNSAQARRFDDQFEEAYLQFAPVDGDMVPKEFHPCAAEPDLKGIGVNNEKAVIVGVIDDGINLVHERFFDPGGNSRIDFAWHQDGIAEDLSHVIFGREFTGRELKELASRYDTEEESLRALGLVDPVKAEATTLSKSFSHGTFVLDRLAGYPSEARRYGPDTDGLWRLPDENEGTNPEDRRIVAVQLHRRVTEESSGALYTLFAMLGLQYIVDRARLVAKAISNGEDRKIPLVVNFSYGLSGGPHNGEHLFERFVDRLATQLEKEDKILGPLVLSMPTGNRHLLKGHAHCRAAEDGRKCLDMNWITQPWDKSPNYLEIWVPLPPESSENKDDKPSSKVQLILQPPFGSKATEFKHAFDLEKPWEDQGKMLCQGNDIVAQVTLDTLDADNAEVGKRGLDGPAQYPKARILIALAPTSPVSDGTAHIPPGVWRVSVNTHVKAGQYIEAWIQRDDSPPLFRRPGRQSFLELKNWSPEWQRCDELTEHLHPIDPGAGLSRYGAISGIATGANMLRVSGIRHYDALLPALYSGAVHEGMRTIRTAAPADRSRVCRGLVGTGGRSGSSQVMNGTSVAAPSAGRLLADFLASNPQDTTEKAIACFLLDTQRRRKPPEKNPSPAQKVLEHHPDLDGRRGGPPLRIGEPDGDAKEKLQNARKWPFLRR